ncbi:MULTISPECIES: ABC transporter permease [Pyrobaculum]|uniref:Nucleoside ABC transporter membrane protein n=2 Tax=Pyrobaculum arsenaticum TaxID=121277 RepID=A4WL79_PYRAR|nr:ABC transporter permease [Pyrobaculum arsenaticum]ABP51146.1 nucleoside ABC transporter membrane protein [Pyrobaculum arsenaticum DSM 13514]MCY0891617.1 ABC transporter permease [Pyrobaculum arsenaticum]NYR15130.1 ABC transporter permease [Pyrobaculum arsenaticum]
MRFQTASAVNIAAALVMAFAVGTALMWISGYDPLSSYSAMLITPLSDWVYFLSALAFSAPIVLTGLTFSLGLRAGLFNIGAEGQVYMGALGAVAAAYLLGGPAVLPLAFAMGLFLAVLWSSVPAVLKIWRGVNEVISTIMMNWVAYWVTIMAVSTVFANPLQPEESVKVPEPARLTPLVPGTDFTAAVPIAYAAAFLVLIFLKYSVWGYRISVSGYNPIAAKSYGIKPERAVLVAFALGSVTAGLAGVLQVVARPPSYSLARNLANVYGLGFDGITAAMLGRGHPVGVVLASIFLGIMQEGARHMQIEAGTPYEFVKVIQGLIILFLALQLLRK